MDSILNLGPGPRFDSQFGQKICVQNLNDGRAESVSYSSSSCAMYRYERGNLHSYIRVSTF